MNNDENQVNTIKGKLTNKSSTSKVSIPSGLVNTINDAIKTSVEKNIIPIDKDKIEKTLEVTIKPDIQKEIEKGILVRDKGSLIIRNKETGKVVSHAKLEENIIELKTSKALSTIANMSGQIQLAEISQKLDTINEKIDLIGKFLWREKTSELYGLKLVIEEAVESLPNKNASSRINDSIIKLNVLSHFFKDTIENLLSEKIEYNLIDNILEGFKVWEWKDSNRKEYNSKYNHKIHSFMSEYGFLIDLYLQTLGLIGTCYQITEEYHHASNYFNKINSEVNHYSYELESKLIFLFDMHGVDIEQDCSLQLIIENIKKRKLPQDLLQELNNNYTKLQEASDMHAKLTSQFENIQLSYELDSKLLIGGIDHE